MKPVRLIPVLDIDGSRVVKSEGVEFRDAGDPAELAQFYRDEGADELVLLDIATDHDGHPPIIELVAAVRERVSLPLIVGGGLRSLADIRAALAAGASRVSLNTLAIQHPELLREASQEFGRERVIVSIDARRRHTPTIPEDPIEPARDVPIGLGEGLSRGEALIGLEGLGDLVGIQQRPPDPEPVIDDEAEISWEVLTHGGRVPTGMDAVEWAAKVAELGTGEILLTAIESDGLTAAYDLDLIKAVVAAVPIPISANCGRGRPEQLINAVSEGGADAVLLTSILHDGVYRIADLKKEMAEAGVPVRV